MPRFPVHDLDTAPAASRGTLAALEQRVGKILNIYGGMAHSPVVLASYRALKSAISTHGSFEEATQQAIALAVAAVDECDYCLAAHTAAGQRAGLTLEQTIAIRAAGPVEPKLDALLAVARQAAGNIGTVDDQTWREAQHAGWSDEQLAELFAHVAVNLFANYFDHYNRTELDLSPAP
ncbi:MAG: carboxymuconolactone decarboxylase family protein [Micromonosporaceae bacterium]|nr:carboxymuconolactone decarboxylase family protein [Micromonosporaceae bacterium]